MNVIEKKKKLKTGRRWLFWIFGNDKLVRLTADDSSSPDRGLLFLCNTQQAGIKSTQVGCWELLSVTVEIKEGKLAPFTLHSKEQWSVVVFAKEKGWRFSAVKEKISLVHCLFFYNWCTKPIVLCSSPYVLLLSVEVFGDCELQTLDHSDIFIAFKVRGGIPQWWCHSLTSAGNPFW